MKESPEAKQVRKGTPFATASFVFLNVALGLLFVYYTSYPTLFGVAFSILEALTFLIASVVWQVIWFRTHRYDDLFQGYMRLAGYLVPVVGLVALSYGLPYVVPEPLRAANQQRPAISLTGKHKAYVTARKAGWTVEIQDHGGATQHKEETKFVPHLSVYWVWGPGERLWLYNSDDGSTYYWQAKQGAWQRVLWKNSQIKSPDPAVRPPELLRTLHRKTS